MKSACLVLCCCLCACGTPRSTVHMSQKEMQACAWLIEDICHGLQRSGAELVHEDSSMAQLNIASWLANGDLSVEQDSYPLHIKKRRRQWLVISQGLRDGSIHSRNNGQLELAEDIEHMKRQIFSKSIDEENQLRINTDRIALKHAGLEARSERARTLLHLLRTARVQLDRQLGKAHEQTNHQR